MNNRKPEPRRRPTGVWRPESMIRLPVLVDSQQEKVIAYHLLLTASNKSRVIN